MRDYAALTRHKVGAPRDNAQASRDTLRGSRNDVLASGTRCKGRQNATQGPLNAMQGMENAFPGRKNALQGRGDTMQGSRNAFPGPGTRCLVSRNDVHPSRNDVQIARNAMQARLKRDARRGERDVSLLRKHHKARRKRLRGDIRQVVSPTGGCGLRPAFVLHRQMCSPPRLSKAGQRLRPPVGKGHPNSKREAPRVCGGLLAHRGGELAHRFGDIGDPRVVSFRPPFSDNVSVSLTRNRRFAESRKRDCEKFHKVLASLLRAGCFTRNPRPSLPRPKPR